MKIIIPITQRNFIFISVLILKLTEKTKILQQKKFSNVVIQISKIKIIKNNDKMDAIVNKISKEISGYSGVKLKPIDVEINV